MRLSSILTVFGRDGGSLPVGDVEVVNVRFAFVSGMRVHVSRHLAERHRSLVI